MLTNYCILLYIHVMVGEPKRGSDELTTLICLKSVVIKMLLLTSLVEHFKSIPVTTKGEGEHMYLRYRRAAGVRELNTGTLELF